MVIIQILSVRYPGDYADTVSQILWWLYRYCKSDSLVIMQIL